MSKTKTIASILIGLVISYLVCAGTYNSWDFISGLEPTECTKRIAAFTMVALLSSGAIRFLIYGFTEE